MSFSRRTVDLKPEGAYQVLARAEELEAGGREIIHLEIGQPDFATFSNISLAAIQAITEGRTRYNPPVGVQQLRELIAADAGQRRGMTIQPEQVVVSPGAKPNLFFPTLAVVDPGDEVIYPDPGFPTYEAMIRISGGIPVPVPLLEAKNFSLDLQAFDRVISDRTRLIIVNSPGNPTGGVIPLEDLTHIAAAAQRCNCWVISDEIYSRIVYDPEGALSIAALPGMAERTVVMDGFSKTYSMTGWRLGFGIMPLPLADRMRLLLTHAVGCTAHFTQYAGIEALSGPQDPVTRMVAEYRRRRNALVTGLNSLSGVRCRTPQGAFYAFPNIKALGRTSQDLANMFLDEAGVALLPGTAFGENGEGYLRLSYAASIKDIERAIEGMRWALERAT